MRKAILVPPILGCATGQAGSFPITFDPSVISYVTLLCRGRSRSDRAERPRPR
jgi:hypothetical protein